MPEHETTVESQSAVHRLIDNLAMRLMMEGPPADAAGSPAWARELEELSIAAAGPGLDRLAAETRRFKEKLAEMPADPKQLSEAFEAGIRALQHALEEPAPVAEVEVSKASASLADDPELVGDFIMESREHLQAIEQNVLRIEQDPGCSDAIHAMFRAFHTIKGLAGFLEFENIRQVSHETETALDKARNGELDLTPSVVDLLLASADYIAEEVRRIEAGSSAPSAPMEDLLVKLRGLLVAAPAEPVDPNLAALSRVVSDPKEPQVEVSQPPQPAATETAAAPPPPETVAPQAVAPAEIAAPAAPVEEHAPAAEDANAARNRGGQPAVVSVVKVDTAKLDFLVDMVGEMVIAQSLIQHSPDLSTVLSASLLRNVAQLSRITNEVQKTAMAMRMVPVGVLFQKMARQVRDLCRKAGKSAELVTSGEDTELDRNIVEELADPLMHMVRNAVDHGVESPEARIAAGKPATARIELRASHQAGHIVVEVVDDGRGMDRAAILKKAKQKGIVEANAQPSDVDIYNLVFEPGFSTAERVTDISGRGVGMDVVKKRIQKLRGRTEIATVLGKGTTFRMKLPLTLAIIEGLIVAVGKERYIVPIFAVKEMLRPTEGMMTTIEGRREMALVRGRVLPVVRLSRRFGVTPRSENPLESVLIIAESQTTEYCLMVDDLIGKQEVVIKSLGESLRNVSGVAGGAILGDGRVGLILEMNAIFNLARNG